MEYFVKSGQNIFDVCVQNFGDIESGLIDLITSNKIGISDILVSGQKLVVNNENAGIPKNIDFFRNRNFVVNNADENDIGTIVGDFNVDFGNDFFNNSII